MWTARADGSEPVRVTHGTAFNFLPSWAPDGAKLAYMSATLPGRGDSLPPQIAVRVANPDGSDDWSLTLPDSWNLLPQWAPDGAAVAYTRVTGFQRQRLGEVDLQVAATGVAALDPRADCGSGLEPGAALVARRVPARLRLRGRIR